MIKFCAKVGNAPIGTYTPAKNPIIVPIIVLNVEKALNVFVKSTNNIFIALASETVNISKPLTFSICSNDKSEPPVATIKIILIKKAINVNVNPIKKALIT